jgi:hypothetical protein
MVKIWTTKADDYRYYLTFISDRETKLNISHHLQYVEFLYKIKSEHQLILTTLSLTNKSIIIELFAIIESIIDALLCQLKVVLEDEKCVPLEVHEYTNANQLLKLALKYNIVTKPMYGHLVNFSRVRNNIHIKRHDNGDKNEHEKYTNDILKIHEIAFKNFLKFLFIKYRRPNAELYPWPHPAFGIKQIS